MSEVKIGIIGVKGKYGQWLEDFFKTQMNLEVIGSDILDASGHSAEEVIASCEVIIFAVPLNNMAETVASLVSMSRTAQLWIEIASHKEKVIKGMLASNAEILGIHTMCAPPKNATMKGNNVVACRVRINKWESWTNLFLNKLNGNTVDLDVDTHDKMMSVVQSLPHAMYIGAIKTIIRSGLDIEELLKLSTPPFKLAWATMARMLTNNRELYAEIQIQNGSNILRDYCGEVEKVISLIDENEIDRLKDDINQSFDVLVNYYSAKKGATLFQQIIDTVNDIEKGNTVYFYSPKVNKGYLQGLLSYFTENNITLSSAHSFPKPPGYVFLFGVDCSLDSMSLNKCLNEIRNDHEDLEITFNAFS